MSKKSKWSLVVFLFIITIIGVIFLAKSNYQCKSHESNYLNDLLPSDFSSSPNVIVFGETGVGKSSLINMIAGHDVAGVSSDAPGFTLNSVGYEVRIDGTPFKLWDTAGLNEGEAGSTPTKQAMKNLQDLVQNLRSGINLLVYCIRGTRFREIIEDNYKLFSEIICQSQVPVVVVITGLEHEEPMESWWTVNGDEFAKRSMIIKGHACVTTFKGKWNSNMVKYMFEEEFKESQKIIRSLIKLNSLVEPRRISPDWVELEKFF